jgi:hypothetical protein
MINWPLAHPATLVHIGLVCRDQEIAQASLSATLGLTWCGGQPESWQLVIDGTRRDLTMKIAHSVQGPPHYELIEAVADTPWVTDQEVMLHHLCYHSSSGADTCLALEQQGFQRVLGRPGDSCGYFRSPLGLLIEIVDDHLLGYLQQARQTLNPVL